MFYFITFIIAAVAVGCVLIARAATASTLTITTTLKTMGNESV